MSNSGINFVGLVKNGEFIRKKGKQMNSYKRLKMLDRNIKIAISVLRTDKSIHEDFGITRERARQILVSLIKKVDPELVEKNATGIPGRKKGSCVLNVFRSHAERLIPLIQNLKHTT
ncbi:MAG: hypothetical protein IMY67_01210 [Bacteroidetes bacterium]|nr:hypothetical protein [Bacteroidota bacterium]